MRSSGTLQSINDEFRQFSGEVELWSFYETQKISTHGFNVLVVDPESATLGYREEKQIPMNADHRSISKFDSPSDPNYLILRNALASTIDNLTKSSPPVPDRDLIEYVAEYLGVSGYTDDDLVTVQDSRMEGTCEWLNATRLYTKWKDTQLAPAPILWITGQPAAGKSVLAGFAIDDLIAGGATCSYYFFKHGDKTKSRLSFGLRCLAFQMACRNNDIRSKIIELQNDKVKIDLENERSIWRSVFESGILQVKTSLQYWVIDGLDECSNPAPLIEAMLTKLDKSTPLRILLTSRENTNLLRSFSGLGAHQFQREIIPLEGTLPDIERFVMAKAKSLNLQNDEDRNSLARKIIDKSNGSFLWTRLVLEELSNCYSEEDMSQVLNEVPHGMESLYNRALETIAKASRGQKLAQAILTWVVCVTRPLSVEELEGALELDLKDKFHNLAGNITALCAQLVIIDKFGKVQMVHETAREFLLNEDLQSEFAVNKSEGNARIARACLQYLTGDEMKPPRTGKRNPGAHRSGFPSYSCTEFSSHLAAAKPQAINILTLVDKFLTSNVLTWIEMTASMKTLSPMVRVARNLRTYLNSCVVELSPLRHDLQVIRSWSTDLQRIAAKFSNALLVSPAAIYSTIIPFCPTESAIHRTVLHGRKLSIKGLSDTQWDDRLCCIDFRQGQTSALAYGEDFFAIGFTGGQIRLYHSHSCQEYRTLSHAETVKCIRFKDKSDLMAASGLAIIQVWNVRTGQLLHTLQSLRKCITLAFDGSQLLAASDKNVLSSWDLNDEAVEKPKRPWKGSGSNGPASSINRPPTAFSIAISHQMLAVSYTGMPIKLWDLADDAYYGTCGKKTPTGETSTHVVTALVLNPNPSVPLLAASYLDGELAIIDPFNDVEMEKQHVNCHTLSASPDGRLLAGASGGGVIQIFEFDTLRLLYKVRSTNIYIKQLVFSQDGLHLADLRGSQCNVWKPPVLLGESIDDDISVGTSTTIVETSSSSSRAEIMVMAFISIEGGLLCGKADGSVCLYDPTTGDELQILYAHKAAVRCIAWMPHRKIVLSICASNKVFAWSLELSSISRLVTKSSMLESRLEAGSAVVRLLASSTSDRFIISSRNSDHFWSVSGGEEKSEICEGMDAIRIWTQHPHSQTHIACVKSSTIHLYSWRDWSTVVSIHTDLNLGSLHLKSAFTYTNGPVVLEMHEPDGSAETKQLYLLDLASQHGFSSETLPRVSQLRLTPGNTFEEGGQGLTGILTTECMTTKLGFIVDRIAHVIGINMGRSMVFLDVNSWVCSMDLTTKTHNTRTYTRHFFVPYDWFAGTRDPISIVHKGDVLFAKNGEVAIIKGGLGFVDIVQI
ncbi:Vegetative incompatibility HET-E-1-like protein [Cladobotryum mycophilum]|uniref:Vegetative incompatibility HET-E-1-like protein n=1 Tax=Cladobotryum mycophilum TaxID=491253 RepID=A0ABR0SCL4_9HYPO